MWGLNKITSIIDLYTKKLSIHVNNITVILFFFKVFTELVTILLLFYCFVFWHVLLVPWLGIELASPALKGEVLTTGLPPGKSTLLFFNYIMEDSCRIPCLRSRALGTTMQNFTSFGEQLELINRIWSFQQYLQCCLKNTIAE